MKHLSSALVAFFLCLGGHAAAEIEGVYEKRMHVERSDGGCFAIIYVNNTAGVYNNTETLETSRGPVSVRYRTIGGHNADEHDIVTVWEIPFGVGAEPMEMALPDGDTGQICLYEYIGA